MSGTVVFAEEIPLRDEAGRILQQDISVLDGAGGLNVTSHAYGYDDLGRLVTATTGAVTSTYVYDLNGNRVLHQGPQGDVVGRYDGRDRLLSYCPEDGTGQPLPTPSLPCYAYGYLESGELLTRVNVATGLTTTYDYDEFGSLRSVVLEDGRVLEYEHDPLHRRVGKWIDGARQWGLLYDSTLRPTARLDAAGQVDQVYVYGDRPNVPEYLVDNGTTYRLVLDHLGSVRMVVNATDGSVAQVIEYDEFGRVLLDSDPGFQPFGFAGGVYDADTGLVRFGARDYDPVVGHLRYSWLPSASAEVCSLATGRQCRGLPAVKWQTAYCSCRAQG